MTEEQHKLSLPWQLDCPPSNVRVNPVPGLDRIWADSNGKIWSTRSGQWYQLTLCINPHGYLQVTIGFDNKQRSFKVHRLVASAFHGPCPDGMLCMHLNDIKIDNNPDNLKWGTPKENSQNKKYSRKYSGRLTENQINQVMDLMASGTSQREISKITGISVYQVQRLARGGISSKETEDQKQKKIREVFYRAAELLEGDIQIDPQTEHLHYKVAQRIRAYSDRIYKYWNTRDVKNRETIRGEP